VRFAASFVNPKCRITALGKQSTRVRTRVPYQACTDAVAGGPAVGMVASLLCHSYTTMVHVPCYHGTIWYTYHGTPCTRIPWYTYTKRWYGIRGTKRWYGTRVPVYVVPRDAEMPGTYVHVYHGMVYVYVPWYTCTIGTRLRTIEYTCTIGTRLPLVRIRVVRTYVYLWP
jgi:hypothetical protein